MPMRDLKAEANSFCGSLLRINCKYVKLQVLFASGCILLRTNFYRGHSEGAAHGFIIEQTYLFLFIF